MINLKFSVTRCSNNPNRWNVYFRDFPPFHMRKVRQILEKHHYEVLATSSSVIVVRSKEFRLTWHNEGIIQLDVYNQLSFDLNDIEHLIKEILDVDIVKFSGESIG